ncbi:unnamed protein product, partial [Discosporangium mesarthrocarpum]
LSLGHCRAKLSRMSVLIRPLEGLRVRLRMEAACFVLQGQRRVRSKAGSNAESGVRGWEEDYDSPRVNWFPGHMAKATKGIGDRLKQVDMVFEVRDARIPFSSANLQLDKLVGRSKARLVVFNKADLANPNMEQRVLARLKKEGKDAIFTCCNDKKGDIKGLMAWARSTGAKRGNFKTTGMVAMVVGMPNVGKSSLINLLRRQARGSAAPDSKKQARSSTQPWPQVARVGTNPGVTRNLTVFRVSEKPLLFVMDTPGVMVPRVSSPGVGLRLALTKGVPEGVVDQAHLADFMLRHLNSR